jgi:N-acetylglutamate synthase-like GNAT family acetyltransferase
MTDMFKILTLQDYGKVADIFTQVFPEKFRKEFDTVWMLRHTELSLGAYVKGELAGFILTRCVSEGHLCIEFLGVNPLYQKDGIGTMLLKRVLQCCGDKDISLVPLNDRVAQWYKKHGFEFSAPRINPFTGELEEVMVYRADQKSASVAKTICVLSLPTVAFA